MYIIKEDNNVVITEDVKGYLDRVRGGTTCKVTIPDKTTTKVLQASLQGTVDWETIFKNMDANTLSNVLFIGCKTFAATHLEEEQPTTLAFNLDTNVLDILPKVEKSEMDLLAEKGLLDELTYPDSRNSFDFEDDRDYDYTDEFADTFTDDSELDWEDDYAPMTEAEYAEHKEEHWDVTQSQDIPDDFPYSEHSQKYFEWVSELDAKLDALSADTETKGTHTRENMPTEEDALKGELGGCVEEPLENMTRNSINLSGVENAIVVATSGSNKNTFIEQESLKETGNTSLKLENTKTEPNKSSMATEQTNKTTEYNSFPIELEKKLSLQLAEIEQRLSLALATDIDHFLVLLSTLVYTLTSNNIPVFSCSATSASVIRSLKHYLEDQIKFLDKEVEAYKGIKAKPFTISHYKSVKRELVTVGNTENIEALYFYLEVKILLDRFVYNSKNKIVENRGKKQTKGQETNATLEVQILHTLVDFVKQIYVEELLPTLDEDADEVKHAIIYTDASVLDNNTEITGGVGVVLRVDNKLYEYGASLSRFKNDLRDINFYELSAIALGVRLAVEYHGCNSVEVYTDSQAALLMLNNKDLASARAQKLRDAYLENIYNYCPDLDISYSHVKAHEYDFWNNRVDNFAKEARESTTSLNAHAIFKEELTEYMVTKLHI